MLKKSVNKGKCKPTNFLDDYEPLEIESGKDIGQGAFGRI